MNKKEINIRYYKSHKEQIKEQQKKWRENNPNYRKDYYKKNKEKMYESNLKWKREHPKRASEMVLKSKRKRVEILREQGCTNAWNVVSNGVAPKLKEKK